MAVGANRYSVNAADDRAATGVEAGSGVMFGAPTVTWRHEGLIDDVLRSEGSLMRPVSMAGPECPTSELWGSRTQRFASTDHRCCVPSDATTSWSSYVMICTVHDAQKVPDTRRASSAETGGWSPRPSAAASEPRSRYLRSTRPMEVPSATSDRRVAAESTVDRR